MRFHRADVLTIGGASIATAFASYFAYRVVGWFGIGVLGLLIAFMGFHLEIEKDGPVGSQQHADLYAASHRARERMLPSERAEERAEIAANVRLCQLSKMIGTALIVVGLSGFYFFQLPP
jgi:hypothetical protein